MRRSTRIALTILVVCAAGLVFWFSRPAQQSDQDQIIGQINTILRAGDRKSIGPIMSVISPDYQDDNQMNPDRLRLALSRTYHNAPDIDITATQPLVVVTGNTATSDSSFTITDLDTHTVYYSHAVHLDWRKEKGFKYLIFPTTVWRITHAEYGQLFDDQLGA